MKIKVYNDNIVSKSFRDRGNSTAQFYPIGLTEDLTKLTKQEDIVLIDIYNSVPEISSIINYISQICAKIPYKFVQIDSDKEEKEIEKPELNALLQSPNYYQNNSEFTKQAIVYYLLLGNTYINKYKAVGFKMPKFLYLLPPQYVNIIFEKMQSNVVDPNADFRTNDIKYYQLKYGSDFQSNIEPKDIIHYKDTTVLFLNGNYANGFSRVFSAIMATKSLRAGYEAKYSFYKNRGAMGILTNANEQGVMILDDKEKDDLLRRLKNKFGLRENQNIVDIVDQPLNYLDISPDFSGLQINENNEADFRALCKAIGGFPSVLLNDNRTATYNNLKEAQKTLYTNIITPILIDYYEKLTIGFGLNKENQAIKPDFSDIEALREDNQDVQRANSLNERWTGAMYNNNAITLNQYLELNGLDPVPYGNKRKFELETNAGT